MEVHNLLCGYTAKNGKNSDQEQASFKKIKYPASAGVFLHQTFYENTIVAAIMLVPQWGIATNKTTYPALTSIESKS